MKNIKELIKLGINLGIVCLIAALTLSATYSFTRDRIAYQKQLEVTNAQKSIFPDANFKKIDISGNESINRSIIDLYLAEDSQNKEIGLIAIASTQGYSGPIFFVLGINTDGTIKDVRITEQTETPGLGANISKDKFIYQFKGKKSNDEFLVKKDIIPVTSATISSKSISKGIKDATKYLMDRSWEKIK